MNQHLGSNFDDLLAEEGILAEIQAVAWDRITLFQAAQITAQQPMSKLNQFAVCLRSKGYEASLEVGKIYRMIPDADAQQNGLTRVIDESGEDYAFSADRFCPIEIPRQVEEVLLAVG
jgi:hypothetical protein